MKAKVTHSYVSYERYCNDKRRDFARNYQAERILCDRVEKRMLEKLPKALAECFKDERFLQSAMVTLLCWNGHNLNGALLLLGRLVKEKYPSLNEEFQEFSKKQLEKANRHKQMQVEYWRATKNRV